MNVKFLNAIICENVSKKFIINYKALEYRSAVFRFYPQGWISKKCLFLIEAGSVKSVSFW